MSNEIVTIDWLSEDNKKIIKNQFFPQSATAADMQYCIGVAKAFNLNPILKQIYFVPRRSNVNGQWIEKVEPLAGRDSFLTLAHRTGKFAGIESKVEIKETPIMVEGKWTRQNDLVATATVYRKDTERPFVVSVNYREYVQTNKDGKPTNFWATKPETMLKKVAESQVLRKAFDITGLYAEEEYEERYINSDRKSEDTTSIQKSSDINSLKLPPKQEVNPLQKAMDNYNNPPTATYNIDVDIELPEKTRALTPKEIMIQELIDRGASEEQATKWCLNKDAVIPTFLADPASIDVALEEAVGF